VVVAGIVAVAGVTVVLVVVSVAAGMVVVVFDDEEFAAMSQITMTITITTMMPMIHAPVELFLVVLSIKNK